MDIIDLKQKEIFKKEDRGVAKLIDERYLQMNQVCLEPGQEVPQHNANSNVTLTVVHGEGTFHVGNETVQMGPGKLLRVPFQSPMSIKNGSRKGLVFLVIKTPHPAEVKNLLGPTSGGSKLTRQLKNGQGQSALQGFEWRFFIMLWKTGDFTQSEFPQGNETVVLLRKKVRLEAFPNRSPLPV